MEKKLRIAFLNKYQGKVNRGAETYVAELSKRLLKEFDVDVISDINYFEIFKKRYNFIIPTNGRSQVFLIRFFSWLSGAKMIVSGQSGLGADDKFNLLCFPNVFVALTNYQKEWAKRFNPFVKVINISNGVDLNKFNSKVASMKIDLPHPIILSVGALEKGKRLDLVIKAVAKTKASLLIVGKGKLENELQKLGEDMMPRRLKIISLPYEEMPKVYKSVDLFTYPTVPWESFGIVMLEAMASNLPVIATDDPIRREIVGNAGLFVDPIDTEKYAEVLKKALDTKWENKPREQAEKFSWDDIAKKYSELFKS